VLLTVPHPAISATPSRDATDDASKDERRGERMGMAYSFRETVELK